MRLRLPLAFEHWRGPERARRGAHHDRQRADRHLHGPRREILVGMSSGRRSGGAVEAVRPLQRKEPQKDARQRTGCERYRRGGHGAGMFSVEDVDTERRTTKARGRRGRISGESSQQKRSTRSPWWCARRGQRQEEPQKLVAAVALISPYPEERPRRGNRESTVTHDHSEGHSIVPVPVACLRCFAETTQETHTRGGGDIA